FPIITCRREIIVINHELLSVVLLFFFFQAEDGIRDATVTGVQTCALPISTIRAPQDRLLTSAVSSAGRTLTVPSDCRPPSIWREIGRASCREREESNEDCVFVKKNEVN